MGNACSDRNEQLSNVEKDGEFQGASKSRLPLRDNPIFDFRYRGANALDDSAINEDESVLEKTYSDHLKSITQDPFEDPYFDVEYSEQFKVGNVIEREKAQRGFFKAPTFEKHSVIDEESEIDEEGQNGEEGMEEEEIDSEEEERRRKEAKKKREEEYVEEHKPKDETIVERMNPLSKRARIVQANAPPFQKPFDPDNDFNPVYGPYKDKKGETYTGQYKWGKRWGVGKAVNTRGGQYEGQWDRGVREGFARIIKPNGDTYEGIFKNGQFHGKGTMYIFHSRVKTQGDFKNGQPQGYCIEEYVDGSKYEGIILKGKKEGKGKFTFKDKSVYEGDFKNDVAEGKGRY